MDLGNRKFDCPTCHNTLEEPRLLQCLHSFCTKCLITMRNSEGKYTSNISLVDPRETEFADDIRDVKQTIVCRVCDQGTNFPPGGVSQLPYNYWLQNKIFLSFDTLNACQLCSAPGKPYCKCVECEVSMCAVCGETHRKFNELAVHTIVLINESGRKNVSRDEGFCLSHLKETVSYFCCSCSELICSACCSGLHSGHRFETLAQSEGSVRTALGRALDTSRPNFKELTKRRELAKALETKIEERCQRVAQEIEAFIQAYKEALDKHKNTLIEEIQSIREKKQKMVQETYIALNHEFNLANNAFWIAEEMFSDSSPLELLSVARPMISKLECWATPVNLHYNKVSDWVQFLPEEKASSIDNFQMFGVISTQSISPEHCSLNISGLLSCRQHKKASFILITRDSEGKALSHGGEKIMAELMYKDASERQLPVTISDEGDGTYLVTFLPDASGNLRLSVWAHGRHVEGSPYAVCVSTLRQHKGTFHCCSFCSSGGGKTTTCGCGSKMPGGYKGCGHGHVGHPGRRHWSCCGNILQNSECSPPLLHQCSF